MEGNADTSMQEWELSNRDLGRGITYTPRRYIHTTGTEKILRYHTVFIELGGSVLGYKAQEIAVVP